jgi:YVTN family beta-propeller protein
MRRVLPLMIAVLCMLSACAGVTRESMPPKAYVGNFKDNTVSVIDTQAKKVAATIPIPPGPHGMALTPDGRALYVSSDGASTVSLIDTSGDRLKQNIEVGRAPHGLSVTPDGSLVLVAVYGEDRVALIDTATNQVAARIAVAKPHNIAIRSDGRTAYVASQEPGKFELTVIDIPSRSVVRSVPLDKTPRALEFSPDGKYLYFTQAGLSAVAVLDPNGDRIMTQIAVGASPHYANFTRNGRLGLTVSQGPGELAIFSTASNTVSATFKVGKLPHWVAASGDSRTAYTTNEGSNDVSIVDIATGGVSTVPVGNTPRKIAVQQGETRASMGSSTESSSAGASAPPAGATVRIKDFSFVPASTKISVGEQVNWVNDDAAPHAIAVKGGKASRMLAPGQSVSLSFEKPGTYEYICSVHPYMTGKVIVQ